MKFYFSIMIGMTILSCKSENRIDLLSLKPDMDLSSLILDDTLLKKDYDPNLGLVGYTTQRIDGYQIGVVKLNKYAYANGNLADYNNLTIFVNGNKKIGYLGFNYSSVNQEETKAIIEYLKKRYPTYQQRDTKGNGESFFWEIPIPNIWIFSYQGISTDKNGRNFFSTNFIVVKKGTHMENNTDTKHITIRDYYKMMYPDLIK